METGPNTVIIDVPIERSPIQQNFDDTEIIPGLPAPETRELPPVREEIPRPVQEAVRKRHGAVPRPKVTSTPTPPRPAPSGALWERLRDELTDFHRQARETLTPKNWARFLGVVTVPALVVALTVNQFFGPETGPLSNLRVPIAEPATTAPADPTYEPIVRKPEPERVQPAPVPTKTRPKPVKRSRKPAPAPSRTKKPEKTPEPSPSESETPPVETPTSDPPPESPPEENPNPGPGGGGNDGGTNPPPVDNSVTPTASQPQSPEPTVEASP